jgi:hypothetical protein
LPSFGECEDKVIFKFSGTLMEDNKNGIRRCR